MQKRASKNSAIARGNHDVLSPRELNRATLERQMLLRRRELPALDAIEHLVGMQAQAPSPPYVGLWTRLEGFRPDELGRLITERRAVRIALMRNTVHLVSAQDCLALRPLMQPVLNRTLYSTRANRAHLDGMDIEALVAAGRALLERSHAPLRNWEAATRAVARARPYLPRPRHSPPPAAGPGPSPGRLERAVQPPTPRPRPGSDAH